MALAGRAGHPRRMTSGVTLRSGADLLAAVPYLLGFHPRESIVVVAMRRERVLFAGRSDLPGPMPMGAMAARFVALLARDRADAVAVIGYGPPGAVTPAVDALRAAVDGSHVFLLDAIRVEDGRYWSYVCEEPSCCPPEGQPFDAETSPVALSAVYHGQVALPDREALAAQVAPLGGAAREAMRVATLRADDRFCDLVEAATGGLEVLAMPVGGLDRIRLPPGRAPQPPPPPADPAATPAALSAKATANACRDDVTPSLQAAPGVASGTKAAAGACGDGVTASPAGSAAVGPGASTADVRRSGEAGSPPSPPTRDADGGPCPEAQLRGVGGPGPAASVPPPGGAVAAGGLAPIFAAATPRRRPRRRGGVEPGVVRRARLAKAMFTAGRAAVANAFDRYRDGGVLTDDEVAWLSVLLSAHLPVRDLAWEHTGDEEWHVALWTDVLRRVEPDLAAGPASLLAFAAWRNGNGALAGVAVERALAIEPAYSMARLMDEVLEQCLAPHEWDRQPRRSRARRSRRRSTTRRKAS